MTALPRTPTCIGVAADHGGYDLKEQLARMLREAGYDIIDFGDVQPTSERHRRRLGKVAELENKETRS